MDWLDLLAVQGILQESSLTPQFKSINSSALSFLYSPVLTSILYRIIIDLEHLVSDVQKVIQLCTYLFFFRFFSHVDYYRMLNRVPCAIQ